MTNAGVAILILCFFFSRVDLNQNLSVRLHKCCQRGEILNLHTKKCSEDTRDRSDNQTLEVFPTPLKDDRVYYPINYDFVMIEKCHVSHKINLHFKVYGSYERLAFFDPHSVEKISHDEVCFDLAEDDKTGSQSLVAQKCLDCEGPCINFCCPDGSIKEGNSCKVSQLEKNESRVERNYLPSNFTRVSARIHCQRALQVDTSLFRINLDNEAEINGVLRHTSEYCIDEFDDEVQLCAMIETPHDVAKLVMECVSIVALILVIILHLIIEELRVNHITKLKIPLYLCILISFWIVVASLDAGGEILQSNLCIFLGLLLQFSALSVFFWLTSISVDVWMTFRALRNPMNEVSRIRECYLFSTVCPLLITLTTVFLQLYDSPDTDKYVHPGIGDVSCSLAPNMPKFLYFHLPICILLTVNLIMFCCFNFQFACGAWRSCLTRACINNYKISAELFFLMGINWIAESIQFFLSWLVKPGWNHHPVFQFLDFFNWSIGLIILLFFLCKASNRGLIRNLYDSPFTSNENISKSLSSQISNVSSDSKFSIRLKKTFLSKLFGKM